MPVLVIYGFPEDQDSNLRETREALKIAITAIPELRLTKDQISCFFQMDMSEMKDSKEIIVFVKGLYDKPERTQEVRDALAKRICAVIDWQLEPFSGLIECFIEPFNVENGFYKKGP